MNIKQQILAREGFRATPQKVGASLVVGIGYNLTTRGVDALRFALRREVDVATLRLTEGEAWAILEADVARAEAALDATHAALKALDPVRRRAVLDLAMQPGVDPLRFTEAAKALAARDWTGAAMAIHRALKGTVANDLTHMILTGREPGQPEGVTRP